MFPKDSPIKLFKSITGGGLLGAGLLGLLQSQHLVPGLDVNQAMTIGGLLGGAAHRLVFDAFLGPAFVPVRYYSRIIELSFLVRRGVISITQAKKIREQLNNRYFLEDLTQNSILEKKDKL